MGVGGGGGGGATEKERETETERERDRDRESSPPRKRPSSVRPTLQLFQRQLWGNIRETRWSTYGLSLLRRYPKQCSWARLFDSYAITCPSKDISTRKPTKLDKDRSFIRHVISEEILAGTEIPGSGGGFVWAGGGGGEVGLYLMLQNNVCIKMSSDESHVNIPSIIKGQGHY